MTTTDDGERRRTTALTLGERDLLHRELEAMKRWAQVASSRRFFDEPWHEIQDDMRGHNHPYLTGAKFGMVKEWAIAANSRVRLSRAKVGLDQAVAEIAKVFEENVVRYAELSGQGGSGPRSKRLAEIQAALGVSGREFELVRLWCHDIRVHHILSQRR